jgi:hypothetical protein
MAYFVGMSQGQQLSVSSDTEGGSAPTADVYVTIGSGNAAVGSLSRYQVLQMIETLKQYIASDAPPNGANLLSSLLP